MRPSLMEKILRVGWKTGRKFCITAHAARGRELLKYSAEITIGYEKFKIEWALNSSVDSQNQGSKWWYSDCDWAAKARKKTEEL